MAKDKSQLYDDSWIPITKEFLLEQEPWIYKGCWIADKKGNVILSKYEWIPGRNPDRFHLGDDDWAWAFNYTHIKELEMPEPPMTIAEYEEKMKNYSRDCIHARLKAEDKITVEDKDEVRRMYSLCIEKYGLQHNHIYHPHPEDPKRDIQFTFIGDIEEFSTWIPYEDNTTPLF